MVLDRRKKRRLAQILDKRSIRRKPLELGENSPPPLDRQPAQGKLPVIQRRFTASGFHLEALPAYKADDGLGFVKTDARAAARPYPFGRRNKRTQKSVRADPPVTVHPANGKTFPDKIRR